VNIRGGLVSVDATNATLREILAEWARVGHTTIVNGEKVPSAPLTIQLVDVPEGRALDVLLRSVSGYVAAPRRTVDPSLSRFDRILVMPASSAPKFTGAPAGAPAPAPFQPPRFAPQAAGGEDDQNQQDQPAAVPTPPQQVRPVFNTFPQPATGGAPQFRPFPQPMNVNPAQGGAAPQDREGQGDTPAQPQAYPQPTSPAGVATPGMPVPVPASPGQQPNQGQPPVRPRG
jgi:hypothetical protein